MHPRQPPTGRPFLPLAATTPPSGRRSLPCTHRRSTPTRARRGKGMWPNRSDLPVRLEAGAFQGRSVYFEAIFPWSTPSRRAASIFTSAERSALALIVFTGAAIILGAAVFASRNLRAGRGDRRGAFRLSALIFVTMCGVVLREAHVASLGEVTLVIMALAWALLVASCCWVGYLAAEPYVRRRWPRVLVSWVRVLAGRVRDPLVGRDVLIGCVGGTMLAVLGFGGILVPGWFGFAPELVPADIIGVAYGLQRVTAVLVWRVGQSVTGLAAVFSCSCSIFHRDANGWRSPASWSSVPPSSGSPPNTSGLCSSLAHS